MSISLHPDTAEGRTLAAPAAEAAPKAVAAGRGLRSRLFTKYVALFVAVVAVALLSNGIFEVFFYYREHKASLIRIQHEQAEAAAAKIGQFIKEIESQLGWTTQLPWSAGSIEQRRFDALRLLRQVPAITELAQVDSSGKERLRVSRLAMDVVDSGLDLSKDAKFTEAMAHKVYYGPVYFRRESEPYMTLALAGTRKDAGVSIAEVNLKLIWDVVSQIKVGEHGHAYVVGAQGRLIAHPDISLVLRNTDMSGLVQVQAARSSGAAATESLQGAKNIQGQEVLTASAPIQPLRWTMFVELPVEEAYASLWAALQRLAVVLLAASTFAVLAGVFLARRMVGPIQALRAGAERIGSGDFAQRISIPTGDELEGLANQFNDMGARLQESYAGLENKVEQRTAELSESLEQQTATSEVLKVISSSPGELDPVFLTMLANATRICKADFGLMYRYDNGQFQPAALLNLPPALAEFVRDRGCFLPALGTPLDRLFRTKEVIYTADETAEFTPGAPARLGGARSLMGVPMLKEKELIGAIIIYRQEVHPFTDKQVQLVRSFASQAVIAIENARLLKELRQRTEDLTESLEQQTAISDILRVISSSPGEIKPVFDAVARHAADICEAQVVDILNVEGDKLIYVAQFGDFDRMAQGEVAPLNRETVMGRSIVDKRPVHVADLQSPDHDFPLGRDYALRFGHRTTLAVPLVRDDQVLGTILIRRAEVRPFEEKHIALLKTFADQAVIAIENARLLNELRQRTDDLSESLEQQTATSEVLQVISSSQGELRPVFQTMLESATRVCGANFGTMNLWEDGKYNLVADHNIPAEFSSYRQRAPILPYPGTALATVLETHRAVQVEDVRNSPAYKAGFANIVGLADIAGARTILVVPMLKEDELIGVITIIRQEVRQFTAKQVALVENFTKQAVIAIENTRLLNELRERTDALTTSLEELRTAQDRLVQTEKLASLGQLTAGIAHEIKNPLNFVNNFSAVSSELIEELNEVIKSTDIEDKTREEIDELTHMLKGNLEKVVQHGKRADSIVKNMLLHSREGSGEHRPADINAIVEESLNLAYHGARAERSGFNITLRRELDPDAGMIDLYPQEITRVFLNLISNGFYAATKRKHADGEGFEPTLQATTKSLGDKVEIRIRDNGTGIPPEVKEKMFNPFFTTKPAGEGTGLGLSMSHDIIVKQHGGKIDVATEPGSFTEFIITLPRKSAALGHPGP